MPIVTIHMLEGRDAEIKKRLIRDVTETVVQTLEVPRESVRIMLNEMPEHHYGVAGLPVKEYRLRQIKHNRK